MYMFDQYCQMFEYVADVIGIYDCMSCNWFSIFQLSSTFIFCSANTHRSHVRLKVQYTHAQFNQYILLILSQLSRYFESTSGYPRLVGLLVEREREREKEREKRVREKESKRKRKNEIGREKERWDI